jgi:nicotinamide phosphoribosyltransferase
MLWDIFGGTVNEKGYKVLDKHVKAIYGDSITPQRCKKIYEILESYGFSIENVVLGVGSFSFMCLEEIIEERIFEPVSSDLERFFDIEGREKIKKTVHMNPYTRDTFGYAIKATYGEDKIGAPVMIYKQPKALAWKKSPKGCIVVAADGQSYTDEHTFEEAHGPAAENLLELVFRDGKMIKETSLKEIRTRMYGEDF